MAGEFAKPDPAGRGSLPGGERRLWCPNLACGMGRDGSFSALVPPTCDCPNCGQAMLDFEQDPPPRI
jgi:hypothetical protein